MSANEKMLSATQKILVAKEKISSRTQKILSPKEKISSRPQKILSAREKIPSVKESIFCIPHNIFFGIPKIFSVRNTMLGEGKRPFPMKEKIFQWRERCFSSWRAFYA